MADPRWERLGAATGIVAVVFLVVGYVIVGQPPVPTDPPDEIAQFMGENADTLQVQQYLYALAGGAFLWFLGSLRSFLRRAEGDTGRLSAVSFGGGVATVVVAYLAGGFLNAGVLYFSEGVSFFQISATLFGQTAVPAAVTAGAASIVVFRTNALPGWFAGYGAIVALASAVGSIGNFVDSGAFAHGDIYGNIVFFGFLLWVLAASVLLVQKVGAPSST